MTAPKAGGTFKLQLDGKYTIRCSICGEEIIKDIPRRALYHIGAVRLLSHFKNAHESKSESAQLH